MANYPRTCTIRWNGYASAENNGNVSIDYSSGTLFMGILLTGTPVMGWACTVSAHALNFKYKNGETAVSMLIDGSNFNKTLMMEVTPDKSYEGKTLDFAVTIAAATGSVIQARVGW